MGLLKAQLLISDAIIVTILLIALGRISNESLLLVLILVSTGLDSLIIFLASRVVALSGLEVGINFVQRYFVVLVYLRGLFLIHLVPFY